MVVLSAEEERLSHDPAVVIVMLSRDETLIEVLPPALARLEPKVEVQAVGAFDSLDVLLGTLRPDALILDTEGLLQDDVPKWLVRGAPTNLAVIVLSDERVDDPKQHAARLGIADYVCRQGDFLPTLCRSAIVNGRLRRLGDSIQETERHYRDIIEALSDGVFVLLRGRFHFVNQRFAAFVGRSVDELLTSSGGLLDLVPAQQAASVRDRLALMEDHEDARESFEVALVDADGHVGAYEIACHQSRLDGHPAIVGVARDVTAARKLQAELAQARERAAQVERLRALGELAAGVAHDFNNSLGTILGRLSLAKQKMARGEPPDDELNVIQTACRQAASTVQRIQRMSRPTGPETWDDVDLGKIVQDAVALVRTHLTDAISLTCFLDAAATVRGNRTELLDVVHNLLRNAVDAVEGKGAIEITTLTRDGQAIVEVSDNGHGIDAATQRRILEPFFTTKGVSGTGLGLSVSHWILRRHDAQIEFQSEPGKGTRVRIIFSSLVATKDQPRRQDASFKKAHNDKLSIVVVDDDATVADMITDMLHEQGHQVRSFAEAGAVLVYLEQATPMVLLTDLDLPDMSGWELARAARKRAPELIVGLVTGWPIGASEPELRSRGVNFVLGKPFSLDALTAALSTVRQGPPQKTSPRGRHTKR